MRDFKHMLIYCTIYMLVGVLSVNHVFIPVEGFFSLWVAGGFGFFLLARYGKKALPFLFFSNLLLQLAQFYFRTDVPLDFSLIIVTVISSAVKTIQSMIMWLFWQLINFKIGRDLFTQGKDVLLFLIGVAFLPALITSWAYVAVYAYHFSDIIPHGFKMQVLQITVSDTLGAFLFGPIFYSIQVLKRFTTKDMAYLAGCYLVPFLTVKLLDNYHLLIIMSPAAIVAAYNVDIRKLIPFHVLVMCLIMWMTTIDMTVFSNEFHDNWYWIFLLFSFVATVTIYFTSIVFKELNDHKLNLESKVLARTKDLEKEIVVRRKAEKELKVKDILVNTILSSSPIGITLIRNRKVVWINEGAAKILGYETDEVINESTKHFYANEKEYYRIGKEVYPKILEKGYSSTDTKMKCRDGSLIDVLMQAKPLDSKNIDEGLIFTFVDITKLKKTQKDLERYAHQLEESNKELDAFAHSVAHDLKNPLNAVMGFSDLMIEEYDYFDDEEKKSFLKRINIQSDKMLEIIDSLLLLSGVRKENVRFEPCDMNDVLSRSLMALEKQIEESGARIEFSSDMPLLNSHGPWLEVVWVNFISNAIKYGGTPAEVEIGYKEDDFFFEFWVSDNGQGIPPEKQKSLFIEFVRIKYDKNGHGLGLSIVKRIVERLNGEVFVESVPGNGSRFGFKLPRVHISVNQLSV